jgi:hypothetical protein
MARTEGKTIQLLQQREDFDSIPKSTGVEFTLKPGVEFIEAFGVV